MTSCRSETFWLATLRQHLQDHRVTGHVRREKASGLAPLLYSYVAIAVNIGCLPALFARRHVMAMLKQERNVRRETDSGTRELLVTSRHDGNCARTRHLTNSPQPLRAAGRKFKPRQTGTGVVEYREIRAATYSADSVVVGVLL